MRLFQWLTGLFTSSSTPPSSPTEEGPRINPATGLPMITPGIGGVGALAMPFGMVVFGPLADIVSIEVLLIAAGILTFVVIGAAVLLPAGRRAITAARAASGGPAAVEAVMERADRP